MFEGDILLRRELKFKLLVFEFHGDIFRKQGKIALRS